MSQQIDLNQLRITVLQNQQQGENLPSSPARNVFVDSEGSISVGNPGGQQQNLSRVPQSTFAASAIQDRRVVAQKLPSNTKEINVSGVTGWVYNITSELGDPYTMFLYNDGSLYQVKVVFPEVEGRYGQHDAHLFQDGSICFGDGGGLPTLEQAYAKSVLWATGFSAFLRTGNFPFSINNLPQ